MRRQYFLVKDARRSRQVLGPVMFRYAERASHFRRGR
jgi:hypothetical protein